MATTHKVKVKGVALFLYRDPESKARRWARLGDTITVDDDDLKRLKNAQAATSKAPAPDKPMPASETETTTPAPEKTDDSEDADTKTDETPDDSTTDDGSGADTQTNNDPYDEMNVAKAVEFLAGLPEADRAPYFAREQEKQRKGVLAHFDLKLVTE